MSAVLGLADEPGHDTVERGAAVDQVLHRVGAGLRFRQRQLYTYRMQGVIPFIRIGRSIRYRLRDLDAALQRLPAEQREVLLLVGLEQLSYAETGKALGIPIGTVMSRLSRGRERLHTLMSGASAATNLKVVK